MWSGQSEHMQRGMLSRAAGWVQRQFSNVSRPRDWLIQALGGGPSASGLVLSPDTMSRSASVQACVRVLSETIASLPVHVLETDGERRRVVLDHPVGQVLRRSPNAWQTSVEWRQLMMNQVLHRGACYSRIVRDRGKVVELDPWLSDRVNVHRTPETGETFYRYTNDDGRSQLYAAEDVLRVQWVPIDKYRATTPIAYARETIGLQLAQTEYRARFFSNGARPDLVLQVPEELTEEAYRRLNASWHTRHGGLDKAHGTAILEQGTTVKEITMSAVDAQFLEQMRFDHVRICGLYGVPPHLTADMDRATFANTENTSIHFAQYTLVPWLKRWEEAIAKWLLPAEPGLYVKFDLRGLLRGDQKSRSESMAQQIMWGVLSPNEARALEDLDPYEGGDEYLRPANMLPMAWAQMMPKPTTPPATQAGQPAEGAAA